MLDFFDDFFHFFAPKPHNPAPPADDESNPVEEVVHEAFDAWQDATDDFFDGLSQAADNWGDGAQDFVSAWQQATESFADQFAHWFGWSGGDDSPV